MPVRPDENKAAAQGTTQTVLQKTNPRFLTVAERATVKPVSTNPRARGNSGGESTGRVAKGMQSIGLNIPAFVEYLGESVKQGLANTRDYLQSAPAQEYAEAVSDFNVVSKYFDESSPEYQAALNKVNQLRVGLVAQSEKERAQTVDPDSRAAQLMGGVQQLQEEALEGTSGVGRFVGETALSIGNNLAMLPANAIIPGASLAMMGASAAAGKAYELGQRGVGAGEALTRGVVSGGIEALTEKIPLDNLIDLLKNGGKSALWNILTQAGTEAGEEGVAYVLNYMADEVAGDPEAEFVLQDFFKSMGMGALSGGIMGAGSTAIHRLGYDANADTIQQAGTAKPFPEESSLHFQQGNPIMDQAMALLQEQMGVPNAENVLPNAETALPNTVNVLEEQQKVDS